MLIIDIQLDDAHCFKRQGIQQERRRYSRLYKIACYRCFKVPENDQLDVYIVQTDTPFPGCQRPFPLMEGPECIQLKSDMYTKALINHTKMQIKQWNLVSSYLVRTQITIYLIHETLTKTHDLPACKRNLDILRKVRSFTVAYHQLIERSFYLIITFSFRVKITSTCCTS